MAKTLAINTLSQAVKGSFSEFSLHQTYPRCYWNNDLQHAKNDFSIKKGPIFANFVLADEINRAPAKVQSALLESMQEKQVTIGDNTFKLQLPFQEGHKNPIEQEGTYPLPEAQMDRFMLKRVITYPEFDDEQQIIRSNINESFGKVKPVVSIKEIIKAQESVKDVYTDEKIEKYILKLIFYKVP